MDFFTKSYIYLCLFLLSYSSNYHKVDAFEPITAGFAVGGALLTSALFAGYDFFKCQLYECCEEIDFNITGLQHDLKTQLHGQHLVIDSVVKLIRGHTKNHHPEKALVLSFHGWTGSGKNFVSRIIANNLFKKGMKSRFVNLFVATHHFAHEDQIEQYKDQIRQWISSNVSACSRSIFIFDEMDKMPVGLIDAIKPFIDHHENIDGVDYRKSLFIFLSNTGGHAITRRALEHWSDDKRREELQFHDLEPLITLGAFNEAGGLWHSSLIEKNLVSAFIPFLPMERQHVKLCIRDDLLRKHQNIDDDVINRVADILQYYPDDKQVFCKSGCKRVSQKVDLVLEDLT